MRTLPLLFFVFVSLFFSPVSSGADLSGKNEASGRTGDAKSYTDLEPMKIKINTAGEWKHNGDNALQIVVDGLTRPTILLIDIKPIHDFERSSQKPNIRDADFIEGLKIVRRIDENGSYPLTLKKSFFSLPNWFGQDNKPVYEGWEIGVCALETINIQLMPTLGAKNLGRQIELTSEEFENEFSLLSTIKDTFWGALIAPGGLHQISGSEGGMLVYVYQRNIVGRKTIKWCI